MFIQFFIISALICQSFSLTGSYDSGLHNRRFHVHLTRKITWGVPYEISHPVFCGGSIINEQWILTAAYCVFKLPSYSQIEVLAGKEFMSREIDPKQQSRVVTSIHIHPSYPGSNAQHDIALLKVNESFHFNNLYVNSIAIEAIEKRTVFDYSDTTEDDSYNNKADVSGLGSISRNYTVIIPENLQLETVTFIDNEDCKNIIKEAGIKLMIFDTQLCTKFNSNNASTCIGDSGSPLTQDDIQIGIVSWGMFPCGMVDVPSVYTKVSSYVDWIKNTMNSN